MQTNILNPEDRKALLEAAVAAPSADNSQPWQYHWVGDVLDLWIDCRRAGKSSDARYVLSDLALGACIENISIQACARGYTAMVQYLPDVDRSPHWAARLKFIPTDPETHEIELAKAIHKRCTDRRFPWKGPIEEPLRQELSAEVAQIPGANLIWLDSGSQRDAALQALQAAESLRFKSQQLHRELFSSICFSVGRKGSCQEGLSPRSLGVELLVWPFFKALRHWPVMRTFNMLGGARVMGFRSAILPIKFSPGLVLLCSNGIDRPDILNTGRALERIWLRATAAGLSVQPYAAPGVLGLGLVKIESSYQDQLKLIRAAMDRAYPDGHGLLLLRIGRALKPHHDRGSRRQLSSFQRRDGG